MPDWTLPMQQTFEYYEVNPNTWKDDKKLDNVKSSSITRDSEVETLGSATFTVTDSVGECFIRIYLVTVQNGITEKHPLGTYLVQTPSSSFNGKVNTVSMEAYTPLLELKENPTPLGYSILKGSNIMEYVCRLTQENVRAPVVVIETDDTLTNDFVSNSDDTWLSFNKDLVSNAKYSFGLDELGRVIFLPEQETEYLQPVWTFDDDNSSILYPELTLDHDIYGIPNVVEVIYSSGTECYQVEVVNDDENSPLSTVNRGRRITYRDTNPSISGIPTKEQIQEYAERLLKKCSIVEYTVTFKHGYCPVRLGDCVRLNYTRAGINNVKAKVINQTITCRPGCPVTTTAVFTTNLWR